MAAPLGTAPRRVSPGVWKTATGRALNPAGSAYWEGLYRGGHTDGKGHMTVPSVMLQPPKPPPTARKPAQLEPPVKYTPPGFNTVIAAKRGDKQAARQVRLYTQHQQAVRQSKQQVQTQTDVNLFGQALPAVYGAYQNLDPVAAAVAKSFSPTEWFPHILQAVHGQGANPAGIAADIALALPYGRIGRMLGRGVEAARAAETGTRAGRALPEAAARTVRLGEHVQQFPASQSRLTLPVQHVLDRISEALTPTAERLRSSQSPFMRALGRPVMTSSALGRVAKQAGRMLAHEGGPRRMAPLLQEARTVAHAGKPLGKRGASSAAHFWYAHLPASHRNVEGLRLIRENLDQELRNHTSGAVEKRLLAEIETAKQERLAAQKAGDTKAVFAAIGKASALKAQKREIPQTVTDIARQIRQLDHLIANPVKNDPHVIEALRALEADRRDILVRAGKLNPHQAANRVGLLSRHLGLEPGGEVYIGHRSRPVRGGRGAVPSAPSVGKTMNPAGVGHENTLALYKSGRLRTSLKSALEDWHAAQRYEFHNIAKEELGRMGKPIEGRPLPEHVVVNPKGHLLPRVFKDMTAEERAAEAGVPHGANTEHDVAEYVQNYLAQNPGQIERMMALAAEHGHLADLRQVPYDVAHRYFGQFITPKLLAGTLGLPAKASAVGKVANLLNDAIHASLLWGNQPGYFLANSAQNEIMAVLHQGMFHAPNISRAVQLMADPKLRRLRDLMAAEVGQGATLALDSGSPLHRGAAFVNAVTDNPARLSALIHELARMKVISKVGPIWTKKDIKAATTFLTDKRFRAKLNDARDRAVQSQVDFGRLGPFERSIMKKLIFVYGWLRAGSRYPFRFAADHPARSAALAYTFAGAPGAPSQVQQAIQSHLPTVAGGMPPWLEGALNAGHQTINGVTYSRVFPTRQISPVSTPWDLIQTAINQPGANTVGQSLNPLISAAWYASHRQTPFGANVGSYSKALQSNLTGLEPGIARAMTQPSKLYPGDKTLTGRLERAARLFPIAINPDEAYKARVRSGMVGPKQRAQHVHDQYLQAAKVTGLLPASATELPKPLKDALDAKAQRDAAYKKAGVKTGKPDFQQKAFAADVGVLLSTGRIDQAKADRALAWAKTQSENAISAERRMLTAKYFGGSAISDARTKLELAAFDQDVAKLLAAGQITEAQAAQARSWAESAGRAKVKSERALVEKKYKLPALVTVP